MNREWIRHITASLSVAAFFLICVFVFVGCSEDSKVAIVEETYPGLSLGMLKNAKLTKMKPETLAEASGAQITSAELQSMLGELPPEFLLQLKKNLIFLLEQRVAKTVLIQEAKSAGVPTEGAADEDIIQALALHVTKSATVPEEDIQKFFDANKAMIGETPYEEAKEPIQAMLLQEKQQEALNTYLEQLERRVDIRVNRDWFEEQSRLTRDNPVDKARSSGKPSVIQFDAATSPPGEMMQPLLESLQKKYPDTLNVVFVNLGEEQILGARYGIRETPTQVFYDKSGKEASRNAGMLTAEELAQQVAKIGVN
jgi:thiol-disulfide isomerase/thioredoxin